MGSRGGEYEREALILSRALVPLWFLSGHPERNSSRRAKSPAAGAARRVVAQASFSCPCGAIHLLAPYKQT